MNNKKIKILKNGPYKVDGSIKLVRESIKLNKDNESIGWSQEEVYDLDGNDYNLCRCGHSKNKPFCDGTHVNIDFNKDEVTTHEIFNELANLSEGPRFNYLRNQKICVHARFCSVKGGSKKLIVSPEDEHDIEIAKEQIHNCPSGAIEMRDKDGNIIEENYKPEISLVMDPLKNSYGPIWIKGNIEVLNSKGESYEVRNRVTLCRCGESKNMPFCDGSHYNYKHMNIKK